MDPVTICAVAFDGVYTRWVPLYGAFLAAVAMGGVGGAIGYWLVLRRYRLKFEHKFECMRRSVLQFDVENKRLQARLDRREIDEALIG